MLPVTNQERSEYSVYQCFHANYSEAVRRFVPLKEAIKAFQHYTTNVAARTGLTERVIMTDGGDNIVVEWIEGRGITWPPKTELFDANK
jgi:hypothetical protein